jgi:beta-glucosidase
MCIHWRLLAMKPLLYLSCLAIALSSQAQTEPYKNPDLPAEKRAADLVSRMKLEEKVLQMQNSAPALERLGIPAYDWWNEALHGVARAGQATVFPQAIGMAAAWDTDLMHRIADVISTEARAKYNEAIRNNDHSRYHGLTFWSPNINIFRDPRWGRGQETYGEDPFLTGRLAVEFIRGLQGDDPHYFKVIATAKHYAVHSGPEPERHQFDVTPSARDLADTYLPAFRAAIVEGKADSVMCAYNSVDGKPACVNTDLLQKHLKDDWGFQGFVVSDCGAISDIFRGHKYKANAAEASAVAVKAGTDLTCGSEYRSLVDAVKSGLISEAEIDRALERLMVARFKLGMFDPPERVPFSKIPYSENDSAEHRKLALEAARKAIVLLKNDGTLPLKPGRKIAVIGPSADDAVALLGNYNGFSSHHVTPLEGLWKQFGAEQVRFAMGAAYTEKSHVPLDAQLLTPPGGEGRGLLVEYFNNDKLEGSPKLQRVEAHPFRAPGLPDKTVVAAVGGAAWSARWSGSLRAPYTGDYVLGAQGAAGVASRFGRVSSTTGMPIAELLMHVFLDDKEIVGAMADAGLGRVREAHVSLEAGHTYRLRVEYKQPGMGGSPQLVWIPPAAPMLAEAIDAAKNADVVLAFVGLNPSLEGEEMPVEIAGFKGGDRTNLDLPASQKKLLQAVAATGKPMVVILTSGSALAANFAAEHASAMLEAWYDGEETGTAIAETLAGVNNPAGRLPVTFYKSVEQLPPFEDYAMKGRTYRYFTGQPLYGFGFGLSYSKFQYSGLHAERTPKGGHVSVRVKNDSARDGDEVVQLYLDGAGGPADPIRSLRGFQRVHLRAGESREVLFDIPVADLPASKTKVNVGGGQPVAGVSHVEGVLE